MALGDYRHHAARAHGRLRHFANGGKLAKPYGILELVNSKGDLIYSPRPRRAAAARRS